MTATSSLVKDFLSKTYEERQAFLRLRTKEQRALFLEELASSMGSGEPFSLEDFLSLDLTDRVLMTPHILNYEPTFTLEVMKDGVQLEVATSGGGRFGKDRKFRNFSKGVHTLSFRAALILLESYGEQVEFLSQRGKVKELHLARQAREAKQQKEAKA